MRRRQLPAPTANVDIAVIGNQLRHVVDDLAAQESRLILESAGAPIAAVFPLADLTRLLRLDERDREAWEALEAMRKPFKDVPPEEIERQTERIMDEIKAENRAMREQAARSA